MNISDDVTSHIAAVEFGFLSSKEIKSISVQRITNPVTFNTLLHPSPGGLYDETLGSFQNGQCKTCNLRQTDGCSGHCGHIELPVRVYHPTYLDQLLRLLRGKCVFCHHFRTPRADLNKYICKLRLIHQGLVKEAYDFDTVVPALVGKKKTAEASDSEDNEDDSSVISAQNGYVATAIRKKRQERKFAASNYTELASEARRNLIKTFMLDITKDRTCATCGGRSPTFRKEKSVKIFMKALPQKKMIHNAQNGLKMLNPLAIISQRQKEATSTSAKYDKDMDEAIADINIAAGDIGDGVSESGGSQAADASDEDFEEEDMLRSNQIYEEDAAATRGGKGSKTSSGPDTFLGANEVHAAIVLLFENEPEVLRLIYSPRSKRKNMEEICANMFFIDTILVPPSKYRPENPGDGNTVTEHARNTLFKAILTQCANLYQIHQEISGNSLPQGERAPRTEKDLKLSQIELQECVNGLVDRNNSRFAKNQRQADGIKQTLEKKEGLFRQNMMGKRVNFAGRSVISPDPNIETNEIGVPPVFASKLTYPEPLNEHNIWEMRQAVINGDKWPGAAAIELEDGKLLSLLGRTKEDRIAIANQLLTPTSGSSNGLLGKKVHRHLNNGDIVIMNRQPTLHKPSMMCHRTRVLTGEKTIRMHYANCNTYNADFDGDEMNMHFPQTEQARAEANLIADTDHQYLSSTAGKPLRGLIQDHLSLSVHLTNRDSFFDREKYQQLIYSALRPENGHTVSGTLKFLPPAIMKPRPLWTGKQLISTVLKNLTPEDKPGLYLESKSQTAGDRWGDQFKGEASVLFDGGELMHGILDKKQIGPALGGFVHAVYETFGPSTAGRLLSTLGRLLTKLLHMNAFSCGVEDIILTPSGDETRRSMLKDAATIGLEVAAKYVTLDSQSPKSDDPELLRRLESVLRDDEKQKGLDEMTKGHGAFLSSAITKACLPDGLIKPWPKNQMQLMTGSGAKGSQVNANLISCNLGQQILEGRRVPTMVSGKTLPCFTPFDSSVRAGGFIADRFLTGVNPQEYYFHAMAGREGLIDTAVKTSRSGYLQRCLIKGMEGLKVEYDTSVRDSGDGSIIQFLYGEDGLDTTKSTYINQFKFTAKNFLSLYHGINAHEDYPKLVCEEAKKHNKKVVKALQKGGKAKTSDPAVSIWDPSRHAGSMSEKFYRAVTKYVNDNNDGLIQNKKTGTSGISSKAFTILADMRYMKSLVEPGEAVGIVAAQSVGEPSTQMTLNTFHLAGHSSKNVTLGIPRLREIVMTASAKISTPNMTLHLNSGISIEDGEQFAKTLSRISLSEVVDRTKVMEEVGKGMAYTHSKFYKVRFDFFPAAEYQEEYNIEVQQVLEAVATQFLPSLSLKIVKELRKKGSKAKIAAENLSALGKSAGRSQEYSSATRVRSGGGGGIDGDASGDEEEDNAAAEDEMGADATKMRQNRSEMDDYAEALDDEDDELASQTSDGISDDIEDEEDRRERDDAVAGAEVGSDEEDVEQDEVDVANRDQADGPTYINETPEDIFNYVKGIKGNETVFAFKFDPRGAWCEATLEYSATEHKLLILSLVENCTRAAVIQAIPLIKSCMVDKDNKYKDPVTDEETVEPAVITEGCNLEHMREYADYLNPNKMFTNDIAAMLRHYGVEACRSTIVREMHAVFSGHAIDVDFRHLNLIADCMTRSGGFLPFSRVGMKNAVSAFMKMSFETTLGVLKEAVAFEETEDLKNPSARLVIGSLSKVGTGSFDVLLPTDGSAGRRREDYED